MIAPRNVLRLTEVVFETFEENLIYQLYATAKEMQIVRMLLLSLFCDPKHQEGTNRRDGRRFLLSFCQQTTMCFCWLEKRNTSLFSENSGLFGYKIPKNVIKRRFSAQKWCHAYCSWQVPHCVTPSDKFPQICKTSCQHVFSKRITKEQAHFLQKSRRRLKSIFPKMSTFYLFFFVASFASPSPHPCMLRARFSSARAQIGRL